MYYIWEWRVACWRLYLITCDYCREQENTILSVLQIYRKRERAKEEEGGWWGGRGGVYIPLHTTNTHTHPTHTLYIMTIIYNLNEGFKHCASLHCLLLQMLTSSFGQCGVCSYALMICVHTPLLFWPICRCEGCSLGCTYSTILTP